MQNVISVRKNVQRLRILECFSLCGLKHCLIDPSIYSIRRFSTALIYRTNSTFGVQFNYVFGLRFEAA